MRGELSVSCAYPTFIYRGGTGRGQTRPDKPFKINRVPAKPHICSRLASRIEKPSAKAGRFRFACVALFMSCRQSALRD